MTSSSETPSRGLIRSMLVTGSAQAASIVISIGRTKVLAVLLGPAGVGILSIFGSLKDMVSQFAGLGIAQSGVRDIALARGDEATLDRVRRVLFVANLVQGSAAMLAVWVLREPLAAWLLDDPARTMEVGVVGVTILLALIFNAQATLLQGLRRIGDLAKATIVSALLGTIVGLAAIWQLGAPGLIWLFLVQSLAGVVVMAYFTRKVPKTRAIRMSAAEVWQVWKPMVQLGLAFMLGGLATAATMLVVRAQILQVLGLDAAGHFAAAWGLTMIYIGFLLNAMGADYYPRLTEVIHDDQATGALINDQMQLGLAIGGPVLLLLIGWAPWVVPALYSHEFAAAVILVQWQSLGNLFKIAAWPMSYSHGSAGRSNIFLFTEVSFNVIYSLIVIVFLKRFGLAVTGTAFLFCYVFYMFLNFFLVRRYHSFSMQALSIYLLLVHAALGAGLLMFAYWSPVIGGVAAPVLTLVTGIVGLRIVLAKLGPEGRVATRMRQVYSAIGWPINSPLG